MNNKATATGSVELSNILARMNEDGQFLISVLTDRNGFPIAAAAASGEDPNLQSAVVALVQKTAAQVQQQLQMAPTDEISIFDAQGRRLVCRPFTANEHQLILAALIPNRHQSYRRLTNTAIRAIRRQWKL